MEKFHNDNHLPEIISHPNGMDFIKLLPSPLCIKLQHLQMLFAEELGPETIDTILLKAGGDADKAASILFKMAVNKEEQDSGKHKSDNTKTSFRGTFKNLKTSLPHFIAPKSNTTNTSLEGYEDISENSEMIDSSENTESKKSHKKKNKASWKYVTKDLHLRTPKIPGINFPSNYVNPKPDSAAKSIII